MTNPEPPDIFSLLTRRAWTPPAATRPPISVAAADMVGRNITDAPVPIRNIDDEETRVDVVPFFARDPYPIPAESDREDGEQNPADEAADLLEPLDRRRRLFRRRARQRPHFGQAGDDARRLLDGAD